MPVATPAKPFEGAPQRDGGYAPGQLVAGKYRLEALIGEGGMGEVWLAENTTLHVDVALKLIRAEIAGSEEAAQRLLHEARAAAQIEHHAIVRVHDFGATELDDPFIVMELLKGQSLDDRLLDEGRLPAREAVAMILPILGALSVAHPKGIVHRDIKPDNIFLSEDEQGVITPKLVDFGIAKLMDRTVEVDEIPVEIDLERPEVRQRLATRMTQAGQILGSPEFMSPEQICADRDIDGRADLWGVGVVLYDALAGRRPFGGEGEEDLLLAVLTTEPEPIAELDPELWAILARALAKDREDRYPDARQMGVDLARWLVARGVDEDITGRGLKAWLGASAESTTRTERPISSAPPERPTQSHAVRWAVGVALGLGVAAAAVAIWLAEDDAPASLAADTAAPTEPTAIPSSPAAPVATEATDPEPPDGPRPAASSAETVAPKPVAAPPKTPSPRPAPRSKPRSKTGSAKTPAPKTPASKPEGGKLPIPDQVTF